MKNIILALMLLFGVALQADASKGQKYYLKFMKKTTGLNGAKFAQQHSQSEWKVYFDKNAKKFIAEYSKKYPKASKFLAKDKFKSRYAKHIKDFVIEYANDSGNVPSC